MVEKCALILDVHSTHRTKDVKTKAKELGIELIYVPAGGTSKYQPLDRRVFGELKSRARKKFRILSRKYGDAEMPYQRAMQVLLESWDSIDPRNIRKAFCFGVRKTKIAKKKIIKQKKTFKAVRKVMKNKSVLRGYIIESINALSTEEKPWVSIHKILGYMYKYAEVSNTLGTLAGMVNNVINNMVLAGLLYFKKNSIMFSESGKRIIESAKWIKRKRN